VSNENSNRIWKTLVKAAYAGLLFGIIFLICGMSAAFLVTGDGNASPFSHFMFALIHFPINLFGLERRGTVFPASAFWGAVFGVLAFVFYLFRNK
jgi:hypothetical protein